MNSTVLGAFLIVTTVFYLTFAAPAGCPIRGVHLKATRRSTYKRNIRNSLREMMKEIGYKEGVTTQIPHDASQSISDLWLDAEEKKLIRRCGNVAVKAVELYRLILWFQAAGNNTKGTVITCSGHQPQGSHSGMPICDPANLQLDCTTKLEAVVFEMLRSVAFHRMYITNDEIAMIMKQSFGSYLYIQVPSAPTLGCAMFDDRILNHIQEW